jgi:preprotein translocase subunit YajC
VIALFVPLAASSSGSAGTLGLLLPLVLMGSIFYFLLIRPQQRQRRKQASLLNSLDVGDEVQTVGGMYGVIKGMDDESVWVEVSPDVEIRFQRGAIARKLVYDEYDEDEGSAEPQEEEEGAGEQK